MLPALRSRNFRLLWIGLGISFAGSFMQQAAILWHVSLLVAPERKALALGLVGLVRVVPIVGFSLFSGVAADVFDRRKLMLATQLGGAAVAIVLIWSNNARRASASAGRSRGSACKAAFSSMTNRDHCSRTTSLK